MKKIISSFVITTIFFSQNSMAQNVGIGTTTPLARLHVTDSSVVFSAAGLALPVPGNPPIQGAGRRMMWYADKAAFRVGYDSGNEWDKINTGYYSFSSGYGSRASGDHSIAMGLNNIASGANSVAIGYNASANSISSTAIGTVVFANNVGATALGTQNTATGHSSTVMGKNNIVKSIGGTVIGMYNDALDSPNPNDTSSLDRIFQLGNGYYDANIDDEVRRNALTVLRNGNVGIGTTTPTQKLDVNGTIKTTGLQMPTGAGAGKILKTDANGIASWGTIDGAGLFSTPPIPELTCPLVVGSVGTGTQPTSVAVAGNYAYVVGNNTLQVINITNPAAPVLTGSVGTGLFPRSVAVAGNYAYVANFSANTMQVFNISNPSAPVVVGSVGTGGYARSVAVVGSYAYVVNQGNNTMQIINITNPAAPVLAGSVGSGTEPNSVAVVGNYAYVVNGISNTMQVFNISNSAAPVVAGSIGTGNNPRSVAVVGNYAYVVNYTGNSMQVINISNPSAPVLTGSVGTGTEPNSVAVAGNYAYVANYRSYTLQVFNITNPAAPVVVGSGGTGNVPISLAAVGNYVYVVNNTGNSLQVFNLAACSQNFTASYNNVTGQTAAVQLQWNTNGINISNSNLGNVGIGTSAPTATLSVNGNANNVTGAWSSFSDARIKTIAGDFADGLNVINKINSIRFTYNPDAPFAATGEQFGVVAQELEKVAPYMVTKNKTGKYDDLREVNNQAYTFLLINAVKELSKQNDVLRADAEKQKATYEARLKAIEDKLKALPAAALTTKN